MSPLVRRIIQLLGLTLLQGLCLFVPAGTLAWAAAWWCLEGYIALLALAGVVMLPQIAERGRCSDWVPAGSRHLVRPV